MSHTIIVLNAGMNLAGGINRYGELMAQATHRLHMVGVVVREENVLDSVQRKAIVMEMLFQHPHTYTHVYHQTVIFCEQKITVSTTSTT